MLWTWRPPQRAKHYSVPKRHHGGGLVVVVALLSRTFTLPATPVARLVGRGGTKAGSRPAIAPVYKVTLEIGYMPAPAKRERNTDRSSSLKREWQRGLLREAV